MIDHLVYAVPDLAAAVEDLRGRLGITLSPGGPHVGLGTRNFLASLGGGTYLEVIGPDPDQPRVLPIPFHIDCLEAPRLLAWAVRVDGIASAVGRAKAAGYDPGPVRSMARYRPDGVRLAWQLTEPPGTLLPFLIDWGTTPHPSGTAVQGLELLSFTVVDYSPDVVRKGLKALGVDAPVEEGGNSLVAVLKTPVGEVVLR